MRQNNRAMELAGTLAADLKISLAAIYRGASHISDSLRVAVLELPWKKQPPISGGGRAEQPELVTGLSTACLDELAQCILEEADIASVIEELSEDFISDLPSTGPLACLLNRRVVEARKVLPQIDWPNSGDNSPR